MTLNGVMAVTLRYSTESGKPALQKTICGGIYARVYYVFSACTMSSYRKLTFAISSYDEFLITQRNFVADFLQAKCDFRWKRPFCVFEPSLGAYGQHTMIILGSLESA